MHIRALNKRSPEIGFTLLELIVVLLIVGILSAIAVPNLANVRKENTDKGTHATLTQVADELNGRASQGLKGRETTLSDINTKVKKSAYRDTVLGLTRTVSGYCLTAYNEHGTADAESPMIYDSSTKSVSYEPTVNCSSSIIDGAPQFIVAHNKELKTVPTEQRPQANVCGSVVPGKTTDPIYGQSADGASVRLMGSFTLTDDCQSIDYDLRVLDADENKTYTFTPQLMTKYLTILNDGKTQDDWRSGNAYAITIQGTETVNTKLADSRAQPLVTEWNLGSEPQYLYLKNSLGYGEYSNSTPINWNTQKGN